MSSIVLSAAAQLSGFPPKVEPCAPCFQSMTFFLATMMPRGRPEATPFAMAIMSGSVSQCSIANILPVRPMPLCTSSTMSRMASLFGELAQFLEVAGRRHNISTFTLDRLDHHHGGIRRRSDTFMTSSIIPMQRNSHVSGSRPRGQR